jgi:hypothetical protein
MSTTSIRDWLAVIGLSSLIATLVGHWFSSAREHRRWVYENKRLEWRELVDRFHTILQHVHYFRSGSRSDILEDLNEGFLLLQNRLFIAEILERWKVADQWKELIVDTMEPKKEFTALEIIQGSGDFEQYLLDIARLDLKGGWERVFHKRPTPFKPKTASAD